MSIIEKHANKMNRAKLATYAGVIWDVAIILKYPNVAITCWEVQSRRLGHLGEWENRNSITPDNK